MLSAKVIRSKARKYPQDFARVNSKFLPDAAFILEGAAKRNAPVNKKVGQGGFLRESIYSEVKGDIAIIGAAISYASDVEYGTRPHTITAKNAKVLSDGKTFFGKSVQHPGTEAQPFMRPAVDKNRKKIKQLYQKIFRSVFSGIRGVFGG